MDNRLEIENMDFSREHKWLSNTPKFLNGVPNGYIVFKKLPNIGASHKELKSERNAIITEFNVPILEVKEEALEDDGITKMYPNILIVKQGVEIEDVVKYLKSDITPKKFLTTTHGYTDKIKPAIESVEEFNLYEDFFMLIDECDKFTTDVDFRRTITLCLDDFFLFKQKAMISATALHPSDPRFKANGFKILKVNPTYDFKVNIDIINTNNVLFALVNKLKECSNEHVFIFIDSTSVIHSVIKLLGIEAESTIFCSENSVSNLRNKKNYVGAKTKLGNYTMFNFLTSRSFSGVDIKVPYKAHVIMVTHVYRASFSMLDPYTQSVQISGRLRNGFSSLTHITNFNPEITFEDEETAMKNKLDNIECYNAIKEAKKNYVVNNEGKSTLTFDQGLERSDIHHYITIEGGIHYHMIDNYVLKEKKRSYYVNIEQLEKAYIKTDYFIPEVKTEIYNITDNQLFIVQKKKNDKENTMVFAETMNSYDNRKEGILYFDLSKTKYDLRGENVELTKIYDAIGFEKMKELDYDASKMKAYVRKTHKASKLKCPKLIGEIKSLYKSGETIYFTKITEDLNRIYAKYGIVKKAAARQIEIYYDAKANKDKENVNVYDINFVLN